MGKHEVLSLPSQKKPAPRKVRFRALLVQRPGELCEFEEVLRELEVEVDECVTGLPTPEQTAKAQLVVASAQRLLESGAPSITLWPRTIAVVQDGSKTLSAHLNRLGVGMVLTRPVHPRAIRLLLLHEIYSGPERRNRDRITIGIPVRVRAGLFGSDATLLELSPSGARIQMPDAPKIGSKLRLILGRELTRGRPLRLMTKVVRRIQPSGEGSQTAPELGLSILNADRNKKSIEAVLGRFADGPAVWRADGLADPNEITAKLDPELVVDAPSDQTTPDGSRVEAVATDAPAPETVELERSESIANRRLPPSRNDRQQAEVPVFAKSKQVEAATPKDEEQESDRRLEARIPYEKRIVALDEEAARVLVGRDLSAGGMRILPNPTVEVGDRLRVALHCGTQMEPLVIKACVLRDDGDDGLLLTFDALPADQIGHLEKIIAGSGPIQATADGASSQTEADSALIVGELLENESRPEA